MLKKVLLILLLVIFYVFLIRPVRSIIIDIQKDKVVKLVGSEYMMEFNSTSIVSNELQQQVNYRYIIHFGRYFLFSALVIILLFPTWEYFRLLLLLHVSLVVLSTLGLYLGLSINSLFLFLPDFNAKYLDPLGSFGIVLLGVINKKKLL